MTPRREPPRDPAAVPDLSRPGSFLVPHQDHPIRRMIEAASRRSRVDAQEAAGRRSHERHVRRAIERASRRAHHRAAKRGKARRHRSPAAR